MSDGVKDLFGFFLFIILGSILLPVLLFFLGKWWNYWLGQ